MPQGHDTPGVDAARPAQNGTREPLSRERVLSAAVAIADTDGLGALTMRSLATRLGAQPMSLYHHVRDKEQILDGIVDLVFGEMELPRAGQPWRAELRRRAHSCRAALTRHPWALGLLETRSSPGPATLAQHDAVLGVLRAAGFSLPATAQAYAVLDAYVYGFALQEVSLPFDATDASDVAGSIMAAFTGGAYPNLVEFATEVAMRPGYDFGAAFRPGLELVLDGIERLR